MPPPIAANLRVRCAILNQAASQFGKNYEFRSKRSIAISFPMQPMDTLRAARAMPQSASARGTGRRRIVRPAESAARSDSSNHAAGDGGYHSSRDRSGAKR